MGSLSTVEEAEMPATVLAELARLQHAEAGTHAKFVDMREQAQKTQNQLQKLQRDYSVETKARKLLDKSLQAAQRQNEELKKQLKAAQTAVANTSTQSDKSANQLAQYATGLEKQLGYVQARNKELEDEVKKHSEEMKAASQQTLSLSQKAEDLSTGLIESSTALAAEQKLRKSYETKMEALEKDAQKRSRRLEEQVRSPKFTVILTVILNINDVPCCGSRRGRTRRLRACSRRSCSRCRRRRRRSRRR